LTRQGAEELVARLRKAEGVAARHVVVNFLEGKMLVAWEAADRETLEAWMKANQFHFDWMLRVEMEFAGEGLVAI
jgi:hypothetical protein